MYKPLATYRIQFHQNYTFQHLKEQIPYLKKLGIDTIYASPIFEAIPGSTHGYDVCNPLQLNHEIGTEDELRSVIQILRENGIGWIQDIVPNHMAFHRKNQWLMDVLALGEQSEYYAFFDLLFDDSNQKLVIPFLGEPLKDVITQGHLQVVDDQGLWIAYGDYRWPLSESSSQALIAQSKALSLKELIAQINQDPQQLQEIVDQQHYLPMHFEEASRSLNYRRFFTVNELICMRMEDPQVFENYHRYLLQLYQDGLFQGFRIDHIDGLADPQGYLDQLQQATDHTAYIVVEKILSLEETLPSSWPIAGATGYEFLVQLDQLLTDQSQEKEFSELYLAYTDNNLDFEKQVSTKKNYIIENYLQSELNYLVALFERLFLEPKAQESVTGFLRKTISDFLIKIPVYRYYFHQEDWYQHAYLPLKSIAESLDLGSSGAQLFVQKLFSNRTVDTATIEFLNRCMQFSGPLTAKGIEDTIFYTFNRFLALNEVGNHPETFGCSVEEFHQKMIARFESAPLALNATSTHDTKRGEDARARLLALSANPSIWQSLITKLKQQQLLFNDDCPIHDNDAYLLLQSLFATLPLDGTIAEDYLNKMLGYFEKALRESKKRSSWDQPNEDYEKQAQEWLQKNLQPDRELVAILSESLRSMSYLSNLHTLAMVTLKVTCPGVPDFYQGSESWNFSLVDPDNRRPVAYQQLAQQQHDVQEDQLITQSIEQGGSLKLAWTQKLLHIRKEHADIFQNGEYVPVQIKGKFQSKLIAYFRKRAEQMILVIVPIRLSKIESDAMESGEFDWKDTILEIPEWVPNHGLNLIDEESIFRDLNSRCIKVQDVLGQWPLAIISFEFSSRTSGILAHLSSLPSAYGIGDMGQQAYHFIDFLHQHKQRYWQLLPLNPVTKGAQYSPYSSYSAFAGNPLFIDLEALVSAGWLQPQQLSKARLTTQHQVNYEHAEDTKTSLLRTAFQCFTKESNAQQTQDFQQFCEQNREWLYDFALFSAIGELYPGNWDQWPHELKFRAQGALASFADANREDLLFYQWSQYVFFEQWRSLRNYAKNNNVKLIGDLPFYVAHHSADVWAHPSLFELDENEYPAAFAGAPPDAHSDEGQDWGMPLYRWKEMPGELFKWWSTRIAQNLKLFDVIRLDHFRAFHTFWHIPAGASAKDGHWIDGPGQALFDHFKMQFSELPFIAEDLGTAMAKPIQFRKALGLAGMKVIQFGFGHDYAYSEHLPHQYDDHNTVAYLGTHDNNTINGWYRDEATTETRRHVDVILGYNVDLNQAHQSFIRYAHASIAKIAIVQLQDLLGLGSEHRMNIPGTTQNNWLWQCDTDALSKDYAWFRNSTEIYGRL